MTTYRRLRTAHGARDIAEYVAYAVAIASSLALVCAPYVGALVAAERFSHRTRT